MNLVLKILICVIIGYLIGTINPSYIIGKIQGFDIRKKGSGNAGASNALIMFGKITGILCAIFDIAKASFAVFLTSKIIFPDFKLAFIISSVSVILGHMFPFYMGFKGGKGLACLGGVILMYNWIYFLILLACEIVLVLIVDYICFVPLTASVVFPVYYGIIEKDILGATIFLIATASIFYKHIENLKRIRTKSELHFSYLWNKDKEMERMDENNIKIDTNKN